jgi:RNA polymerase sigma-70 factor (ECF subfamily)
MGIIPVHAQRLGSLLLDASAFWQICKAAQVQGFRQICYLLDSRGFPQPARAASGGGLREVQAEDFQDSIRPGLVAMLPRLKRFSDLLVGERRQGTALLGRALSRMLAEEHRYQRGTALDRWAFAEIYRQWLDELRDHADPMSHAKVDDASFAALFRGEDGAEFDAFTTSFLRSLPPQQRLTLLLVYGERFDHIDAGRVLDVPSETISTRLVRISAALADCLSAPVHGPARAGMETPYAEEMPA